ncbi:Angiopoietin 4 [Branchiostoma belcheri]|nr:Angiopoietin 4 [Branchiostoma belcheri]
MASMFLLAVFLLCSSFPVGAQDTRTDQAGSVLREYVDKGYCTYTYVVPPGSRTEGCTPPGLESQLAETKEETDRLKNKVDRLSSLVEAVLTKADSLAAELSAERVRSAQLARNLQEQETKVQNLTRDLQEQETRLTEKVQEQETRVQNLTRDLQEQETRVQNLAGDLQEQETRVQNLAGDLQEQETRLTEKVQEQETRVQNLTRDLQEQETRVQNLTRDLQEQETKVQNLTRNLQEQETRLTEKVQEQETRVQKLAGDLQEQETRVQNLTWDLQEQETRVQNLTQDLQEQETRVQNLTRDLQEQETRLTEKVQEQETRVQNLAGDLQEQETRVQNLTRDLQEQETRLTEKAQEQETRVQNLTRDLQKQETRVQNLAGDLQEQETRVRSLTWDLQEQETRLTEKVQEQETRVQNLTRDLQEQETRVHTLTRDLQEQDTRIQNLTWDLQEQETRVQNLTTTLYEHDMAIKQRLQCPCERPGENPTMTQPVPTAMVSARTENASNYPVVSRSKVMSPTDPVSTSQGAGNTATEVTTATTGPSMSSHVTTESTATIPGIQVRLAGSSTPLAGRVEVRNGTGPWGSVCDDRWDLQDARVVCRQLGFGTALEAKLAGHFGEGSGSVWLDEVACGGDETNLGDCPAEPWGQSDCSHKEDAGVVCEAALRLVGGLAPWKGRVQIRPWGALEWGAVCNTSWTEAEAEFVCRQLGHAGGRTAAGQADFGEGSEKIWLGDVTCRGDETNILSCGFTWEPADCDHRQDVQLVCSGGVFVRLTGSRSPLQGRVEVRPGNLDWGTVCDDGFDDMDAQVVCRQRGFRGGVATMGGDFGEGTGDIWLKSINCIGVESSIGDCEILSGSSRDCSHSQDAGVICTGEISVRLIGGQTPSEGRVEIRPGNGDWGTVCDDGFDDRDAQVVCRQLGYRGGVATVGGVYPEGTGDIWLENLSCAGNESSVADCEITKWADHDCTHKEDAGVVCVPVSDCADLYAAGETASGVYNIRLNSTNVETYCDMDTAGGGWTVIQRRQDGSVPFNRNWEEYKHGFGNKNGEYWLGNENIHLLTSQKNYTLRVDLGDWGGETRYATYSSFRVSGESDQYRLTVSGYNGTAGDSMFYSNGQRFSTVDRDNDGWSIVHCSQRFGQGGWWFGSCSHSNLNGRYLGNCRNSCPFAQGVTWYHWRRHTYSLKSVSLKIRP